MDNVDVWLRRRDGGDVRGRVHVRRRDGGDVPLRRRTPSPPPVVPSDRDVVAAALAARPFYISHRLGGTEYPEFTQRGINASLRAGFKILEVSVRRCASGEFVAIHDWKTTRTVPGTDLPIWSTPWSTLRTLTQAAGPLLRLTDIVDQIPDDVAIAIDHKDTSSKAVADASELQSESELLDYLDTVFGGRPERRVIWKVFLRAESVARARARGYRTMCMLYERELSGVDMSQWDVLGLEWNAGADAWNRLKSAGRPTIAHIITNQSQAAQALRMGAAGLMASYPSRVHP